MYSSYRHSGTVRGDCLCDETIKGPFEKSSTSPVGSFVHSTPSATSSQAQEQQNASPVAIIRGGESTGNYSISGSFVHSTPPDAPPARVPTIQVTGLATGGTKPLPLEDQCSTDCRRADYPNDRDSATQSSQAQGSPTFLDMNNFVEVMVSCNENSQIGTNSIDLVDIYNRQHVPAALTRFFFQFP